MDSEELWERCIRKGMFEGLGLNFWHDDVDFNEVGFDLGDLGLFS